MEHCKGFASTQCHDRLTQETRRFQCNVPEPGRYRSDAENTGLISDLVLTHYRKMYPQAYIRDAFATMDAVPYSDISLRKEMTSNIYSTHKCNPY